MTCPISAGRDIGADLGDSCTWPRDWILATGVRVEVTHLPGRVTAFPFVLWSPGIKCDSWNQGGPRGSRQEPRVAESKMARLQAVRETGPLRLGSPARPWKTSVCLGLTSCWVRSANSQPADGTALEAQATGFSGVDAQTSALKKRCQEPVGTGGSVSPPGVRGGRWARASPTASECSQRPRGQTHRPWMPGPRGRGPGTGPRLAAEDAGAGALGRPRPEEGFASCRGDRRVLSGPGRA